MNNQFEISSKPPRSKPSLVLCYTCSSEEAQTLSVSHSHSTLQQSTSKVQRPASPSVPWEQLQQFPTGFPFTHATAHLLKPIPNCKNIPHPLVSRHPLPFASPPPLLFSSLGCFLRDPKFKNSSVGAQTPNPSRPPDSPAPAGRARQSPSHVAGGPRAEHAGSRAMATGPDLSSSSGAAAAAVPDAAAKKSGHIVSWSAEVCVCESAPVRMRALFACFAIRRIFLGIYFTEFCPCACLSATILVPRVRDRTHVRSNYWASFCSTE